MAAQFHNIEFVIHACGMLGQIWIEQISEQLTVLMKLGKVDNVTRKSNGKEMVI
jgi:hypothetical protein